MFLKTPNNTPERMNKIPSYHHFQLIFRTKKAILLDEVPSCAIYLKTFLNLLSCLQWIPFSIHFNNKEPHGDCSMYELKEKHHVLKIIAIGYQVGALASVFYAAYDKIFHLEKGNDIIHILTIISFSADAIIAVITWNMIWFQKQLLLETLNTLYKYQHQLRFWKLKACCMALLPISFAVATGLLSPYQTSFDQSITNIIINATVGSSGPTDNNVYHTILEPILRWWMFCSGRVASLAKCFIFIFAYTVNKLGDQFISRIQNVHSVDELMSHLQELKGLNELINRLCGTMFINLFVITLSYYAATPMLVLQAGHLQTHWYKSINILLNCFTWVWSCEFHRKVQASLRGWLRGHKCCRDENFTLTQSDIGKMNLLAMEIEHDPVCISCRYFTVNYGLVFSLLGLLVTYAIITFQFQVQPSG